jgi:hypothetical protein
MRGGTREDRARWQRERRARRLAEGKPRRVVWGHDREPSGTGWDRYNATHRTPYSTKAPDYNPEPYDRKDTTMTDDNQAAQQADDWHAPADPDFVPPSAHYHEYLADITLGDEGMTGREREQFARETEAMRHRETLQGMHATTAMWNRNAQAARDAAIAARRHPDPRLDAGREAG